MRVEATRPLAIVVLLCVALAGFWHGKEVFAASQREKAVQVYIPIVHVRAPQASADLQIAHLGLYQSVQDHTNGVPLVAHKSALLRVYAQSSPTTGESAAAIVTVDAYRNGKHLGSLVSESQVVPNESLADDMDSTFNFDLPTDWLEGRVTLTATIDKVDALTEPNENNNARQNTFDFRNVPALNLTIVPITYTDTVTGITFSQPGHDPVSQWLLAAFPVSEINVTIHSPFAFSGDLRQGDEWGRLLNELTTLWASEVGPGSPHIYYGLIPNTAPGGGSWFSGGVSGLGWIGQRVSLGLDVAAETGESAGHEIGHNFGRHHAPCGNPGSVDPHFPYPNASIGVYGVDTSDETLLDPDQTHDVMSYCGPEWVSDYTYEGLFQDQAFRGGRTGTKAEGLVISAPMDGETVSALSVRPINQPFLSDESGGKYRIQLLDSKGSLIGIYPATLYEADEPGVSAQLLVAHIPMPADGARVRTVRFLRGEKLIGERTVEVSPDSE